MKYICRNYKFIKDPIQIVFELNKINLKIQFIEQTEN